MHFPNNLFFYATDKKRIHFNHKMIELLLSLGILFICSLVVGYILTLVKLPPLVGMIGIGLALGPNGLNLINKELLDMSTDLREMALIIILSRGGLSLDVGDLKKIGRSAIMMCFIPATCEILGYLAFAPDIVGIPRLHGAIMGCVMAAVSPAVVVPRMLNLIENHYGTKHGIPQIIIAGSSVDDVYAIVIFGALCDVAVGDGFSFNILWHIPVSIILAIILGLTSGYLLTLFFRRTKVGDAKKCVILVSLSFLFVALENAIKKWLPIAGLLAVICMGITIHNLFPKCADRLSKRYTTMWMVAEMILFTLVGAAVDLSGLGKIAGKLIATIFIALCFRSVGVFLCVIGNKFSWKEILFCIIAYLPKATVQAAIGGIPLAKGVSSGQEIISCTVFAILITAPLGAFSTDLTYKLLLPHDVGEEKNLKNSEDKGDENNKMDFPRMSSMPRQIVFSDIELADGSENSDEDSTISAVKSPEKEYNSLVSPVSPISPTSPETDIIISCSNSVEDKV